MSKLTPAEREEALNAAARLAFQAERLEQEHEAKRDVIVTSPGSAAVKEQGLMAGVKARALRRRIREFLGLINA